MVSTLLGEKSYGRACARRDWNYLLYNMSSAAYFYFVSCSHTRKLSQ